MKNKKPSNPSQLLLPQIEHRSLSVKWDKGERTEIVSFRELVPEIPSTTYASHGMYYHPAKFIPQVVSWFIKNYTKKGDWIIDPFAGAGTLAVEGLILHRNVICLDLNPIIEPLLSAKTYKCADNLKLYKAAQKVLNGAKPFYPNWSRISYWYPPQLMHVLQSMWGGYYQCPNPLTLVALFKTSRKFSYADDHIPKICTSQRKKREIEQTLREDYESVMKQYFKKSLGNLCTASIDFSRYSPKGEYIAKGGTDLVNYKLDRNVDHLITSPPYGRAHEYIRSFKLELAWLGYTDEQITTLINKEIPYRKEIPNIKINSSTYEDFKDKIEPRFIRDYETYFKSVILGLENTMKRVKGYTAIFVGNATYGGIEPPYHRIFTEYFTSKGFIHERTLIDKLKTRKLFSGRKNVSPSGIQTEYLVIFKNSNRVS